MPGRLALVIAANAMLRIAGGASSVLVGVYVADLAIAVVAPQPSRFLAERYVVAELYS